MSLKQLLNTLSRSSAQAVSTLGNAGSNTVKEYLYIKTNIEIAFQKAIEQANSREKIIFLCGSSGDGKSEILTRYYHMHKEKLDFHLDATHSFQPDMTAIETLDHTFKCHKEGKKPLIVGINIGMLGNYAEEGSEEHSNIKQSIKAFLKNDFDHIYTNHIFLNFEDYPKFEPDNDQIIAPFIESLLLKLTVASDDNPFYQAWKQEEGANTTLHVNYRLLLYPEVQQVIIRTLLKVRLKYDQFLTARTLLDFVYNLLSGPGYLFDNLFTDKNTELAKALTHFDPCTIRSKDIDLFMIQNSLNITDEKFEAFRSDVSQLILVEKMETGSWIRFFHMIQELEISNNYHARFNSAFQNQLYDEYVKIWLLHLNYSGQSSENKELEKFYSKCFLEALFRFANRFAPELTSKSQLFLAEYNGYQVSTAVDVEANLQRIVQHKPLRLSHFNAVLELNYEEDLPPVPISASFLDLILKINSGYRPNKHDKNNIVILEELIEDITRRVQESKKLHIHKDQDEWTLINRGHQIKVKGQ
ncbi:DNA phosphorothioation-dependent restriction protein DptF [Endozoicomonas numazuensis]|uniref:DNA phosphorothioation-dependent restriction protein DptF n=1 Tax=Endozoicomonas numazuensis TaxID=1137799 RepID=UPI00068B04E7|nr:DNA phosphorothioation-dependent restriction protein DptF [Endozoicomonas numazuensis]